MERENLGHRTVLPIRSGRSPRNGNQEGGCDVCIKPPADKKEKYKRNTREKSGKNIHSIRNLSPGDERNETFAQERVKRIRRRMGNGKRGRGRHKFSGIAACDRRSREMKIKS